MVQLVAAQWAVADVETVRGGLVTKVVRSLRRMEVGEVSGLVVAVVAMSLLADVADPPSPEYHQSVSGRTPPKST